MAKIKWNLQATIFSSLRRNFRRSPMYNDCLKNAKQEVFIKGKTKDNIRRVKFKCCECGYLYDKKLVEVDHREPVIPLEGLPLINGLPDLNVYVARLFCPLSNLQVICKLCHKLKSNVENKERRRLKNERKASESIPNSRRRNSRPKAKRRSGRTPHKSRK